MTNRELDALVAEKVMGWRRREGRWLVPDRVYSRRNCPRYSTSIAAAWQVVERFEERVAIEGPVTTSDIWRCSIWTSWDENRESSVADTTSAPRAICLAALRAVGVGVED